MSGLIPKNAVIQPWSSSQGKYVSYTNEPASLRGFVVCDADTVFNTSARISIERAAISTKFYHLRFTHSNKYWARRGPGPENHWIVASGDQPDEDTSKLTCTLFELTVGDEERLFLTHVQSGGRVRVDLEPDRVYVEDSNRRDATEVYSFRVVNWDELVRMPKAVAFKGDNDKFLRVSASPAYLNFGAEDANERDTAFEVYYTHDGHVRIRSLYNPFNSPDHWERLDNNMIKSLGEGSEIDLDNSWFWPIKVDDTTIAFMSATNNLFLRRFTNDIGIDSLVAVETNMSTQSRMVVSERVLDRTIYDVKYRVEDARIFDESPLVVGFASADNASDNEASMALEVSEEVTETTSFSNSLAISAGVKNTMEAGIPFITSGKVEISASVTDTLEWGTTTSTTRTVKASYTARVPAKSRVRINYVAIKGNCNVPFSFTQRDRSSFDGQFVTSLHDDGIFEGINYYNFNFDQPQIQPLF